MPTPGRPRALDDVKRGEICALVAAGCGIEGTSRYVGCSASTVRREAHRNEDFHEQLRRAELTAQLEPLHAVRRAAATHWRAAAWLLERTHPDRFARQDPKRLTPDQLESIIESLVKAISEEIPDEATFDRVSRRIRAMQRRALQEIWAAESPPREPRGARRLDQRIRPPVEDAIANSEPEFEPAQNPLHAEQNERK